MRLDQDVLRCILEAGTSSTPGCEFALLMSWICRPFRLVALDTATIWSSLHIRSGNIQALLLHQLALSQRCPLAIDINFRFNKDDVGTIKACPRLRKHMWQTLTAKLDTAFATIEPHSTRIKSFICRTDWEACDYSVPRLCIKALASFEMPRLEHCHLERVDKPVWVYDAEELDLGWNMEHAPSMPSLLGVTAPLRKLSLRGTHVDWSHWTFNTLTTLSICFLADSVSPSIDRLASILSACAITLEYLELQGSIYFPMDDVGLIINRPKPVEQRVILPNVRELVLGFTYEEQAVLVLKELVFPTLRNFTLKDIARASVFAALPDTRNIICNNELVLDVLCSECPLPTVERLVLQFIFFYRYSDEDDRWLPVRFMSAFRGLRSLVVHNTSRMFVESLALPPSRAFRNRSRPSSLPLVPAPRLRHVQIIGPLGTPSPNDVGRVLFYRRIIPFPQGHLCPRLKRLSLYNMELRNECSLLKQKPDMTTVADYLKQQVDSLEIGDREDEFDDAYGDFWESGDERLDEDERPVEFAPQGQIGADDEAAETFADDEESDGESDAEVDADEQWYRRKGKEMNGSLFPWALEGLDGPRPRKSRS